MRICAADGRPITSHVLVVGDKDFHRKSCYCYFAGHKVEGDKKNKPQPCKICEPGNAGKKDKKPDVQERVAQRGRKARAVLVNPM